MSLANIAIGDRSPELVNAVIEIPQGSHIKYEYDELLDVIRLDRVLYSPVYYPLNYGFIPSTRSEDKDQLDILVAISEPVFSGCLLTVRPIGVIDMEDNAGKDWKIVAVAHRDPRMDQIQTFHDLGDHTIKEIQHFFEVYKQLENKWVKFNSWLPKEDAARIINEAHERFSQEKGPSI